MADFVNLETGEMIENVVSYKTAEQVKAIEKEKQKRAVINRAEKPFVFSEIGAFEEGLSSLKNKELGYFLIMQTYIDYKNMLKKTPDANKPMTNKELAEVLGVTTKTVGTLLKSFEQKGLIKRAKVESYGKSYKAIFISDEYCFRKGVAGAYSKRKTDNAVKVFIGSLQEVYNKGKGDIQPADIGFIYRTIQFIHYDTNFLVLNPSERDPEKVVTLSLEALAHCMGLSVEETSRKLAHIQWNGYYVFSRTKIGKELMIKANPLVLYRKVGEPDPKDYFEFEVIKRK